MRAMETQVPQAARNGRVRLMLLEDHALLRTSLCHVLASEPDIELVGDCATGEEALELLSNMPVDLVLTAGEEDGLEFMTVALRAGYRGRFLIMAASADARASAMALKLGASGIFLTSEPAARLIHAVRNVANGEIWIDPRVIQLLASHFPAGEQRGSRLGLTEREERVLKGILDGLSNRKIGDQIGLKEGSVKAVVQQLFGKTGVRTRAKLVRLAMERAPKFH